MVLQRGVLAQALSGTAQEISVPPPTGGLNTRDPRDLMPANDAIELTNWDPTAAGLKSRKGSESFGTGITGDVETLIEYKSGTILQLLVGAGSDLYTLGSGGGTASSIQSGLSNVLFESSQIAGNMILVNGQDGPFQWDGSTITTPSYTGDIATPGADTMNGIHSHRNRLYLWDTDTSDFYYGGVNSISGNFDKFELGQVSQTGGNILMVESV